MANAKELQKFLDLWGPVIQSLPTVINSLEREEELNRHVEILEKRRVDAMEGLKYDAAVVKGQVATLQQEVSTLLSTKKATAQAVKEHEAACSKQLDEATLAFTEELERRRLAAVTRQQEIAAELTNLEQRLSQAQSETNLALQSLQNEIAALEKRKAAAEAALTTLRDKLT